MDNALKQLNSCCAAQSLSVAEIIAHLDASTDQKMFSELYQKVYQSRKMPPYASLFAQLGIEIKNGQVSLVADGANARRRREFLSSTAL